MVEKRVRLSRFVNNSLSGVMESLRNLEFSLNSEVSSGVKMPHHRLLSGKLASTSDGVSSHLFVCPVRAALYK
jgi:hypothetical protein